MASRFSKFWSYFQPSSENTQSGEVSGENNTLNQSITNVFVATADDDFKRKLLAGGGPIDLTSPISAITSESSLDDESDEVKRILEYRKIAIDGDSATALSLLKKLEAYGQYSSGYLAFRLQFNIGVINQNIGELDEAVLRLKSAHAHCPENAKAQTGLAFAELLDGNFEVAMTMATEVITSDGDHRSLAACIIFHAAKELRVEIDLATFGDEELSDPEVKVAYLRYLNVLKPTDYLPELEAAFDDSQHNEEFSVLWASSVLDDAKKNQAFLLGSKMQEGFEDKVRRSADILKTDLECSLLQRPPNKLLLPSQANNAALALRLSGKTGEAGRLLDDVIRSYPELRSDLAQIRAVLFLQEDKNDEALQLIQPLTEFTELQIMASELEAQAGLEKDALTRIEAVLKSTIPDELLQHAQATKARIGINTLDQNAADEALDDLAATAPKSAALVLLKSAYERAFVIHSEQELVETLPVENADQSAEEKKLLASLKDSAGWDFFTLLQAADELLARGYYRESVDLLRDRVSTFKESPALSTLCDACLRGHLGSYARELYDSLAVSVKESVFGWKFGANVATLNGEVVVAVPLLRKLFEKRPNSIAMLDWYVQVLLRTNDNKRIQRLVGAVDDRELIGSVEERRTFVNILVFCGEIDRARAYAYRLFCENQNDHHSWMALSSSVLAFGRPQEVSDELAVMSIQESATFEVLKPDGDSETYTIEEDDTLFPLRSGNISLAHPVAQAAMDKVNGENFEWPFKGGGAATVVSIKPKALAAFHMVLARFEEQFPEASGFKSVSVNFEQEDGLDEMKAMLKQRADYSQNKAKEYEAGNYPIYILGYHLGIDPIEALLGLKSECGISPKVSSCSHADQDLASKALQLGKKTGIIADASACYLMRRLEIEDVVQTEFGRIGVTQETLDIFSRRLQDAESSSFFDTASGGRKAGSMAIRDGQMIMTEWTEEEVKRKIEVMQSDLNWLKSDCELIAAVAKTDPADGIIRFRREEGGRFFDDIFACDGSGRVLISEDFHLRQWAHGLFETRAAWIQALLYHLESEGRLPIETVVKCTTELLGLGEDALTTNAERLLAATAMFASGEFSQAEYEKYCSLIGQAGAGMQSHIKVAGAAIHQIWQDSALKSVKHTATSILLRNLVRNQGDDTRVVIDTIQTLARDRRVKEYIAGWRIGHFVV